MSKKIQIIFIVLLCLSVTIFGVSPVLANEQPARQQVGRLLAWNGWNKTVSWFKKVVAPKKTTVTQSVPATPAPIKPQVSQPAVINQPPKAPIEAISNVSKEDPKVTAPKIDEVVSDHQTTVNNGIEEKIDNNYVRPTKEEIVEVGNLRPDSPYTVAKGLNRMGDVVGYSMKTGSENAHPILFKNGKLLDIGGGYGGIAHAVNDGGQVAGQLLISSNPATGGGVNRAFIWENGKITKIGRSPGIALDINNKKQVVGYMWIGQADGYPVHSFIWEKGVTKDLGTLGGDDDGGATTAYAINNNSQVVGCSIAKDGYQHPFLWEKGKMQDLGNLYNEGGCAVDINDQGQVVGYFYKINSKFGTRDIEAFLWEGGNTIPLVDAPVGFWPYKINNNGDIAGSQNGVIIWRNGVYSQYNQVGVWSLNTSNGIGFNDNGQIAVTGSKQEDHGGYGLIISLPDNMPPVFKNFNANVDTVCAVGGGGCLFTKVILTWEDEDVDSSANISFYYYEDRRGFSVDLDKPGILITDKIKEDDKNEYVWDVSNSDVISQGGTYAIYAVIDDGVNEPKKVYSKQMEAKKGWWDFCNAKNKGKSTYVIYSEDEQKAMGGC